MSKHYNYAYLLLEKDTTREINYRGDISFYKNITVEIRTKYMEIHIYTRVYNAS